MNSLGPDCAAGAPALDSETWEGGAGAGETGLLAAGVGAATDPLDALAPIELNIRVNAPGAADPAGAPLSVFDIPPGATGLDSETWEGVAVEIPTVCSSGGFSIATGLNTRATSFVRPVSGALGAAFDPALAPAPGIVSACSMRVNSPGLRDASGSAAGSGAGSFTGSAPTETEGAATAGLGSSASAAFFSGVACPSNEASKSSSARGAAGTCPKTPVALDG